MLKGFILTEEREHNGEIETNFMGVCLAESWQDAVRKFGQQVDEKVKVAFEMNFMGLADEVEVGVPLVGGKRMYEVKAF